MTQVVESSYDTMITKLDSAERAELATLVSKNASLDELGRTGTVFFNGIMSSNEYNQDLRGDKAIEAYDRMWRSDGQIRAVVTVCELPLIEATWYVKAASDDPLDLEIAQFVQDNLIGGMSRPWYETLKHALTMFRFGFAAMEKVYVVDGDKIRLRKLAPRLARTIYRIFPDENDEVSSVEQVVWVQSDDGTTGAYKYITIPGDKLVWLILDREGNDFYGNSLLRPAYQHWYFKTTLYKIDAVGCERQSMGIPYLVEPAGENITDAQRRASRSALSSLHAHEKQFMLVPGGYTFGVAGVSGQTKPVIPSIEHHDLQIARSVLAQFLNLHDGGSYALSKDGTSFFLQALKARGKIICETFNAQVIRQLVDLNYNVDRYPTLDFEDLDTRSISDLLLPLSHLITAGGLTPNPETENAIRRMINLPDLPLDVTAPTDPAMAADSTGTVNMDGQGKAAQADDQKTVDDGSAALSHDVFGAASPDVGPYWRALTPLERYVDLAAVEQGIDQGKLDLLAALRPIIERQIGRLVEVGRKKASRGETVNVASLDVPYAKEIRAALEDAMAGQFKFGQQQVAAEAQKQKGSAALAIPVFNEPEEKILQFFGQRAEALTAVLNSKLKAQFGLMLTRLSGAAVDFAKPSTEAAFIADLSRFAERDVKAMTPTVIIDAINIGRANEAHSIGAETAQYSAILDGNTCDPCAAADGDEYDVGSDDYDSHMPPYEECDGGDNCRCIYVYDFLA